MSEKLHEWPDIVIREDRTISTELFYPRNEDQPNAIEIGLCDVRAADGLRIVYDFERDGWSIMQATKSSWHLDDDLDQGWTEVYFAQAWAMDPEALEDSG